MCCNWHRCSSNFGALDSNEGSEWFSSISGRCGKSLCRTRACPGENDASVWFSQDICRGMEIYSQGPGKGKATLREGSESRGAKDSEKRRSCQEKESKGWRSSPSSKASKSRKGFGSCTAELGFRRRCWCRKEKTHCQQADTRTSRIRSTGFARSISAASNCSGRRIAFSSSSHKDVDVWCCRFSHCQ